jgi:hypothetical protein
MKRFFTVAILLAITAVSYGQKTFGLRAGANHSYVRHADMEFGKSIGYYGGVTFHDKVTDVVCFMAELYFMDQRYSEVDLSIKSINMALGVHLYPAVDGLYFSLGPEVGQTIGISVDGEKDSDTEKEVRTNFFVGAGYDLTEKFGIQIRYVQTVFDQQQGYDFNFQGGLTYKFGSSN